MATLEKRMFTYSVKGARRGSALVPAMMVVSMLAMLGLSLLSSGISGARAQTSAGDEYRLTSAAESVGTLAAEKLWSGYLAWNGNAPGTIDNFRNYLASVDLANTPGTGSPAPGAGQEYKAQIALPGGGDPTFDGTAVEGVRVVRRDDGDVTHLYVTVAVASKRGEGLATPTQRSVQLVYTIQPDDFEGFDYGILTNNVNCIFCHTVVDSADRAYNQDESQYGTFAKVKVGTLQSMMVRSDGRPACTDADADSVIAGSLYARGIATKNNGVPISNWTTQSLLSAQFDGVGNIVQDDNGNLVPGFFSPAAAPLAAGENLYLNYPTEYADMVDGKLPQSFPPPFPDDGGIDPTTHLPTSGGAGNKIVDPNEFYAEAQNASGSLSGGSIHLVSGADPIDTPEELTALLGGDPTTITGTATGNVVLVGTAENPIHIDGTVAIDGDVVIQGYVTGEGVLLAKGNVYVPSDVQYLDGDHFGVSPTGETNALGIACGGNLMIGDFLQPSLSSGPGTYDIVTGGPDGGYNFTLAEIANFNRNEWSKTQPLLPGPGEDTSIPASWTVVNPTYVAGYVPRYYQFGPGDVVPVFNLGEMFYDADTGTWHGHEAAFEWDPEQLSMWDPADTTNPALYDQVTGLPVAVLSTITPTGGWLSEEMLKLVVEEAEGVHPDGTPLQIDGLLYTNNAIFGIVPRGNLEYRGQMVVNGSLVCADLGLLAPGKRNGYGHPDNVPGSPFGVGLRLNYDQRTKQMINVKNPNQVTIRRTLWTPSVAH